MRPDVLHAAAEDALTGHAQTIGPLDLVEIGRHGHARAGGLESLGDAPEVAHPVIQDRDVHYNEPFVDGIAPPDRGSIDTASDRARANALKIASTE